MSLMGAMTPLVKVAGYRDLWLRKAFAYTIGGAVTSASIGATFGLVGQFFIPDAESRVSWIGLAILSLIAVGRDTGLMRLPINGLRRQTDGGWRHAFGPTVGSFLWGLDLGLVFSTRLAYSGPWLVAAAACVSHSPLTGSAIFLAYWTGRASSVWVEPLMSTSVREAPAVLSWINERLSYVRLVNVAGIGMLVIIAGLATGGV